MNNSNYNIILEEYKKMFNDNRHLYTYVPLNCNIEKDGLRGISTLNGNEWTKYCGRANSKNKEDVISWLENSIPGRTRAFCAFTSPIPDDAPDAILKFRSSKRLVVLPSYEELKENGLVEACYAENLSWEPDNNEPEWIRTEHPDYNEQLVWKATNERLLFVNTEHYLVIMTNGIITPEFLTIY